MEYDRNHQKTHEKQWKTCLKLWFIWIFMVFSKKKICDFFLLELIENHQEYEKNDKKP